MNPQDVNYITDEIKRLWNKLDDIHSVLIEMRDKHD